MKTLKLTISFTLILLSFNSLAATLYVDLDSSGANDGTSWTDAYEDLTSALANASSGDEIWVAEGVYFPTNINNRLATFTILSGVSIYGGFNGTETDKNQRDWENNPTSLSGAIGGPGSADNSYQILKIESADEPIVIDGLKFQRAYNDNVGANIEIIGAADVTISHCVFRFNESSDIQIFNLNDSDVNFEDCLFRDNTSPSLLFFSSFNSEINFYNVTVTDNDVLRTTDAFDSIIAIYNSIFYNNNSIAPIQINGALYSIMEFGSEGVEYSENVSTDNPLFVDPNGLDYSLQSISPAIDFGESSYNNADLDLNHDRRIYGQSIDAGCFEFRSESILFVDRDATGLNNGGDWQNAFVHLEDALAEAIDGDSLWIADGVYKTPSVTEPFKIEKDISILGGFDGTESEEYERNWFQNEVYITNDRGIPNDVTDNSDFILESNLSQFYISGIIFTGQTNAIKLFDFMENQADIEHCIFKDIDINTNLFRYSHCLIDFENCLFTNISADPAVSNSELFHHEIMSVTEIKNSTIAGNVIRSLFYEDGNPTIGIDKSIIYENTIEQISTTPLLQVNYTICQDAENLIINNPTFDLIDEDPLFVNPSAGNYRLQENSPAIALTPFSSLDSDFDLAHNTRVNGRLDAGAYESPYYTLGCNNIFACNFNPEAEVDDGSCEEFCSDVNACNYSDSYECANFFHCDYPGCLDEEATNYNASAGCDDGSCEYVSTLHYVDKDATGLNDGTSWENAFTELYTCFENISQTDEIWVANGVYHPNSIDNSLIRLTPDKQFHMYGGFIGNETSRDQRDWSEELCILSGDIGVPDDSSDNMEGLFAIFDQNCSGSTIDGFIFEKSYMPLGSGSTFVAALISNVGVEIKNCTFRNNQAPGSGAIHLGTGEANPNEVFLIENCVFHDNISDNALIHSYASGSLDIVNCTATKNTISSDFYGLFSKQSPDGNNFKIKNTIIWDNTASIDFYQVDEVLNVISENGLYNTVYSENYWIEDPLFLDPLNNNFRLEALSPAVNSGDNSFSSSELDLRKLSRINQGVIDLGCYETLSPFTCFGDADYSGVVDVLDILAVSSNFGCVLGCYYGDADNNGVIDITDLLSISSNFGFSCDAAN